jgi:uncharacterized protein
VDEQQQSQTAFLAECAGPRRLPIAVGVHEAQSITRALAGHAFPRPLTHDLLLRVLDAAGLRLAGVHIADLREQTFYAELVLTGADGREQRIDCRPSDALALIARRPGTGLTVAAALLDEHA